QHSRCFLLWLSHQVGPLSASWLRWVSAWALPHHRETCWCGKARSLRWAKARSAAFTDWCIQARMWDSPRRRSSSECSWTRGSRTLFLPVYRSLSSLRFWPPKPLPERHAGLLILRRSRLRRGFEPLSKPVDRRPHGIVIHVVSRALLHAQYKFLLR